MKRGVWGEQTAREHLRQNGYEIVANNYRTRLGEIDIIASDAQYIVFVEVKQRKNSRFAAACEAVTPAKQQRIIAAAAAWLQENRTERQPRLDVIEVYGDEENGVTRIHHIVNAFGG